MSYSLKRMSDGAGDAGQMSMAGLFTFPTPMVSNQN